MDNETNNFADNNEMHSCADDSCNHTSCEGKSFGPVAGILIVVVLLALGGFYFWGASLQDVAGGDAQTNSGSFNDGSTVVEEYTMTDDEFEVLLNEGARVSEEVANSVLDTALDDLGDLDNLDAELEALELEL